jgi:competence protein ComEC
MRRPAFYLAICYGVGIFVAFLFELNWKSWATIIASFPVLLLMLDKERKIFIILCCCFIAGGISLTVANGHAEAMIKLANQDVEFQGEVVSASHKTDFVSLTVSSKKYGRVLINIYQKNMEFKNVAGKRIWVSGFLELPQTTGNPMGFDFRLYLRSVGIHSIMQVQPDQITYSEEAVNRFTHKLAEFRLVFEEKLSKKIGKQKTGLAIAMLFGDKSALEDETYESFQRNGTAHILSVSGLHVGFLYSLLAFLLAGKRRPIPNIIIFFMLVIYGVLSGFCPSVTRAILMIGIHILSKVLCRSYDLLSAVGISAIILLTVNPYSLFHVGFQLSFLAVILMGWIFPFLGRMIPKGHILSLLLPIPVLQVAMAPYTAFLFNYVSFGAFVANFGVVFFSGLLIPAGLLAMLVSQQSDAFFELVAIFMELCIRSALWCNELTYAGGKTCIDVISPPVFGLVVAYGLLFFFLSETGRILWIRKKSKAIAWVLILVIYSAGLVDWKTEDGFDKADAVFVDVGQGDCLHIRTPSGKHVLIDGGGKESFDVGKRVLKPYLLKNGVSKIDLAVVTHMDVDHFGGIRSLSADGMVDTLGLYAGNQLIEKEIMKDTGLAQNQLLYLHQGDRISVDQEVWLEILYPEQKSRQAYESEIELKEENPRSLVIRVHLGKYRILMTGDIDTQTENEVLAVQKSVNLQADILKIGHHGSKYSTSDEFLQAVKPFAAVFLTGKNNYGHPDASILEKCREKGIMIFRTDRNGAIGLFGFYKDENPYFRTIRKGT